MHFHPQIWRHQPRWLQSPPSTGKIKQQFPDPWPPSWTGLPPLLRWHRRAGQEPALSLLELYHVKLETRVVIFTKQCYSSAGLQRQSRCPERLRQGGGWVVQGLCKKAIWGNTCEEQRRKWKAAGRAFRPQCGSNTHKKREAKKSQRNKIKF